MLQRFLIFTLFILLGFNSNAVEMELIKRPDGMSTIVMIAISIALLAISSVKIIKNGHYLLMVKGYFGNNLIQIQRDWLKILGLPGFLLLLNFIIVSVCFIFILEIYSGGNFYLQWIFLLAPLLHFGINLSSVLFAGQISAESARLREVGAMIILTSQILGVLLFPLLLIAVLREDWVNHIVWIVALLFIAMHTYRILKSSWVALKNKIPLYYIILYFCTLEILPLWVIYH